MPTPAERACELLEHKGMARSCELERVGLSRSQIQRLVRAEVLEHVSRGLYRLAGAPRVETDDLARVARQVPGGVLCLLSALRFHGLTTQNPFEVWVAIERKAWRPRMEHPPLRLIYLSGAAFAQGVEEHDLGGVTLRVFSAAKTVADCFKFRNKLGIDVALEALREYRCVHPKRLDELSRYAHLVRVASVMRPYLEALP